MSAKPDGGPAFPRPHSETEGHKDGVTIGFSQEGMTLRQWYAGMAMMGQCCNDGLAINPAIQELRSRMAFQQADAMIAHEKEEA